MRVLAAILCALTALGIAPHTHAANLSVRFTWQAPTENEDGTPLSDLKGYMIHFGETSRAGRCSEPWPTINTCYPNKIIVDPSETTQTVTFSIDKNTTMYFTMTAFNGENEHSRWTPEIKKDFVIEEGVGEKRPGEPVNVILNITVDSCVIDGKPCTVKFN